ncbi:MAG: polyprenyl synthetase family protein, partial [Myxococcota bacterium]
MDVQAYMAERIPLIDAGLEARFGESAAMPSRLREAMRHLLFPGGKRLRPIFALAAAEAVGGSSSSAMPLAIAVELVHTYSLIHDDLPCMDDDAIRRGRPTVHVAYDEATAVLAGDALLSEAFSTLTTPASPPADPAAVVFAVRTLAEAVGAGGLVGGQADDLVFSSSTEISAELAERTDQLQLASIHARKTAALFAASVVGGAALAGADRAQCTSLEAFAMDVGIAFQIADDLLDQDKDEATSILRVQGVEDAKQTAQELLDRALGRIES